MQYNLKLFLKNWKQSFFQAKGTHAHLTRKRLGFLTLFYIVWPVWGFIVWISFFLDNLFFPKFKQQPVDKPLFIIGNFRSGSTYLQRLIARDKANFASARTWDIFISPSVIQTKFFSALASIDGIFGSPVRKMLKRFDSKTLGQVDIHKISFFEPEEDENFLLHIWSSFFGGVLFPFIDEFLPYIYFDKKLPPAERKRIMGFYRKIVQRFMHTKTSRHYLSKNPSFSPKIVSPESGVPGCKDRLSGAGTRWKCSPQPSAGSGISGAFSAIRFRSTLSSQRSSISPSTGMNIRLRCLMKWIGGEYLIIKYDDLVAQPKETIETIYRTIWV